ncbi:DUF2239 family protein [Alicyclobacillus curvatus]|nr:DUF2239 family protein [Alicyclobacillus curvatus]
MTNHPTNLTCTAFLGQRAVASGTLQQVVSQVKDTVADGELSQVLIFDNGTSKVIEVDFRGTQNDVLERLTQGPVAHESVPEPDADVPRHVGRPKLGVIAGEVTLLPRHWEWLKSQPGGASVTLRKLVDEARRQRERQSNVREAQETTYRFMTAMSGNFPHYEDALRALFAGDSRRFHECIQAWPPDINRHIKRLAAKAFTEGRVDDEFAKTGDIAQHTRNSQREQ